jgi:hypothetical protein
MDSIPRRDAWQTNSTRTDLWICTVAQALALVSDNLLSVIKDSDSIKGLSSPKDS